MAKEGIFTLYGEDESKNNPNSYNEDDYEKRKAPLIFKILKWGFYSLGVFIFGIIIFRMISTATPRELKNYIIKTDKIVKAYNISMDAKSDFRIYEISVKSEFGLGDAMYIESAYYLEPVENFQIILRCKNSAIQRMEESGYYGTFWNSSASPFKATLKVLTKDGGLVSDSETPTEMPTDVIDPSILSERERIWSDTYTVGSTDEKMFGKESGRYRYFVYSFDDIKINYADSIVELYIYVNGGDKTEKTEIAELDEADAVTRFTIFDLITPKKKISAKKFKLNAN